MTGPKRQVLKIVKKSRNADAETLARVMCVSADYVTKLCKVLIGDNLLHQAPGGGYCVTPKGSRMPISGGQSRIRPVFEQGGRRRDMNEDGNSVRPQVSCRAKTYSIGEVIGEIKMKADLPSSEQVKIALTSNPQSSYKEMEDRMTSRSLICPAKEKKVTWHYCAPCPHQRGIDFQNWTVQCAYEFNERRLNVVYGRKEIMALDGNKNGEITDLNIEERIALPHVSCPMLGKVIAIDRCTDCRHQRGGQWNYKSQKTGVVGWVLCGAPQSTEKRSDDSRVVTYAGKEIRVVPPRWRSEMGEKPVASERDALRVIYEFDGKAKISEIGKEMNFSPEYTTVLCKSLWKTGYLRGTTVSGYELTEKGEKFLA